VPSNLATSNLEAIDAICLLPHIVKKIFTHVNYTSPTCPLPSRVEASCLLHDACTLAERTLLPAHMSPSAHADRACLCLCAAAAVHRLCTATSLANPVDFLRSSPSHTTMPTVRERCLLFPFNRASLD
jgi:hypothetical protein